MLELMSASRRKSLLKVFSSFAGAINYWSQLVVALESVLIGHWFVGASSSQAVVSGKVNLNIES